MMWVLMCFIAIAVGFMMYADVQQHIPDELDFLKTKETAAVYAPEVAQPVAIEHGWQVRGEGATQELFKKFNVGPEVGGAVYDAPVLAFMCDGTNLFGRIDTVAKTTGLNESVVRFEQASSKWPKAQGTNLLSPSASGLLRQLTKKEGPVAVELSYVELGAQQLTFDSTGLSAASQVFPKECR